MKWGMIMLAARKKVYTTVCLVLYLFFLPVMAACAHKSGIPEIASMLATGEGFRIVFDAQTLKVCITGTLLYAVACAGFIMNMKNTRYGEEYGSAKFGSRYKLNRFYRCHEDADGIRAKLRNMQLTEKVMMGLDVFRHGKNLNVLIFGGSGTGKTRGFIIPNIFRIILSQSSCVITDPKGEILTMTGKLFKMMGYCVRVLDLKEHWKSHCYNPFVYFRGDDDILKFVNQAWEAMSDKKASKGEQIWDDQAKNMLISLMMYLYHYAPAEEQNFDMVMKLVQEIKAQEGPGEAEKTVIDILFDRIDKSSATYGYYKGWSAAKGRTLSSIVSTLTAKMTVFNLDSLRQLTRCDELNLTELATEKTVLFCVIPDNDDSYNFIAGTLYSQLIQQLYDYADKVCHGPLPRHVRFLMDEFANIALPDNYQKILATARSRNMSFVIVLQDKSQIEALYEKVYKSLLANCDAQLFLGSQEFETCKYFSDLMDKETVIVKTVNVTHGANASSTKNETKIGRELMTPGELRNLDNRKAVLLVRGENPVIDNKINLKHCSLYKYIADGSRKKKNMYDWGSTDRSTGSMHLMTSSYGGRITPLPEPDGELVA